MLSSASQYIYSYVIQMEEVNVFLVLGNSSQRKSQDPTEQATPTLEETKQELDYLPESRVKDFRPHVIYSCFSIIVLGLTHPCQGHAPRWISMCHYRVV